MRLLLKIVGSLAATVLLCLLAVSCWLYLYTRDLPRVSSLAQFAPTTITDVADPCIGNSTAVPYDDIGSIMRNAISAVETSENDPSTLRTTLRHFTEGTTPRRQTIVASRYLSRTMCYYAPAPELRRQIAELRIAIQLERHYSPRQLFTMFANRVYLGPDLIGVQNGSKFYFKKSSVDLTVPEAALLVALVRSPAVYSPTKHPTARSGGEMKSLMQCWKTAALQHWRHNPRKLLPSVWLRMLRHLLSENAL
jgi:membrane peptidoglycan carboxypeptidase